MWILQNNQGMKKKSDPRHQKRIHLMQQLFSKETNPQGKYPDIQEIMENLPQIDEKIKAAASEWPIEKINKVDLAILRLAVFELLLKKEVPTKVAIDEAVELAKEYGSQSTPSFVNGVLGKIVEWMEK